MGEPRMIFSSNTIQFELRKRLQYFFVRDFLWTAKSNQQIDAKRFHGLLYFFNNFFVKRDNRNAIAVYLAFLDIFNKRVDRFSARFDFYENLFIPWYLF